MSALVAREFWFHAKSVALKRVLVLEEGGEVQIWTEVEFAFRWGGARGWHPPALGQLCKFRTYPCVEFLRLLGALASKVAKAEKLFIYLFIY